MWLGSSTAGRRHVRRLPPSSHPRAMTTPIGARSGAGFVIHNSPSRMRAASRVRRAGHVRYSAAVLRSAGGVRFGHESTCNGTTKGPQTRAFRVEWS
jgi:hypothetical protein